MEISDQQRYDIIMQIAQRMTYEDAKNPAGMHLKACWYFHEVYGRLLSSKSPVSKMMDSVRIVCRIDDVRYEESSKRYDVVFTSLKADSGPEHARTERTDGILGSFVKDMLLIRDDGTSAAVGKKAIIYKYSEHTDKKNAYGGDTFRVAPYIVYLD